MDKVEESTNAIYVIDSLTKDTIIHQEFTAAKNKQNNKYTLEFEYGKKYVILFSNSEYGIVNKLYLSTIINSQKSNVDRVIKYNKILWTSNENERIEFNNSIDKFEINAVDDTMVEK